MGSAIKNTMSGENLYILSGDDDTAGYNLLSGGNLTVKGQGHLVTTTGIVVDNQNALTLQDVNVKNVVTGSDNKAAITVNKGAVLNINASKHNVTIEGTNGDNNDVIYLDKDAAVNFDAQKSIIITDNIVSSDKANTVNFNGNFIGYSGNLDNVTANVNTALVARDGADRRVSYNLNGGVLKYTDDRYLYDRSNGALNSINFNGGALDLSNGSTNNIVLENINLSAPSNLFIDADLAKSDIDRLDAASVMGNQKLNVAGIRLLSDSKKDYTSINFTQNPALMAAVNYTGNENVAYSPISRYLVDYDASIGNFNFRRNGYNPAILAAPVAARVGSYLSQLNAYEQAFSNMDKTMLMTKKERQIMKLANKYAYNKGIGGVIAFGQNQILEPGMDTGIRPFTTIESVGLKDGPKVKNTAYGSIFDGISEIIELKCGWDMTYSMYAGYNGSHQTYDGVEIYQNGGILGASTIFYKDNFFAGLTSNIGANIAEASTMYGSEDFKMLATGIAGKTGYNFEFADGKFIVQPNYLMSYTFVNVFDYTNKADVDINSDPLHGIQIAPGIKFIGNLKDSWQPYLGVQMVWNLIDDTRFMANDISLPDLSVKPYVQYGAGVQKRWGERFTGFLQAMFRNGGRNGVGLQAGFSWALGNKTRTPNL